MDKYRFLRDDGVRIFAYDFDDISDVIEMGEHIHFDEIYVNELVSYPDLWGAHKAIISLKSQQNCKLVMLVHDYFMMCPTYNLLGDDQRYCGLPESDVCERCYKKYGFDKIYGCESRREWIQRWEHFLNYCTEIRTFSNDSMQRVKLVFSDQKNITVLPHKVEYVMPVYRNQSKGDTVTVGLLGVLNIHKGALIIQNMLTEIHNKALGIKIRLIGRTDGIDLNQFDEFSETGSYKVEELPKLVAEQGIDVFLLPSVWPETFSYTAEEIMMMGLPIICFDLGAPAERVRKYEKGMVLSEWSIEKILLAIDQILNS